MKNKQNWYLTGKVRFTILGFLIGCSVPILAITIDLIRLDLAFTLLDIKHLHKIVPIHYLIETTPFVLGFMAFHCGKSFDKIQEKNNEIVQASNVKDNFLASMSHEIRTPMAGIIGVIDLLEKSVNIRKKERDYLGIMRTSSTDLMNIINDILDLSKLKAGKLTINKEETDIRELCTEIKNLFMAFSKSKNVELKLSISSKVPTFFRLDQVRMKQVISNLLSNAIKFSKNGGQVALTLSYESDDKNIQWLKFEVEDYGIGIHEEQLDSIFMPYEQLGDDTNTHIEGTGLGLHICKQLVELMGGNIGVYSEVDKGSKFWFKIKTKEMIRHGRAPKKIKDEAFVMNKNLDLNVLMAEDNLVLCKVFEKMLKKFGCSTVIVHDGQEIVNAFEEDVYDLILMDINMPNMSGLEAMNNLKKNFKNLPPILGASASALKGDIEKYMDLGFNDYITKPFAMEDLYAKLEQWKPICDAKKNKQPFINDIEVLI